MQCPICSSDNITIQHPLYSNSEYKIALCRDCRVEMLSPQPDLKTLTDIYNNDYYGSWGLQDNFQNVKTMKQGTFSMILEKVMSHKKEGTFLDIGCATGFFLEVARNAGFQVYGVDISTEAIEKAKKNFPEDRLFNGSIDDFVTDTKFDVIVMTDLLEHVYSPLKTLEKAKSFLKDDGVIVVLSPYTNSISRFFMSKYWFQYKLEHLFYFSEKSMTTLAEKTQMKIVESSPGFKKMSFDYLFKQSQAYKVPLLSPFFKVWNFLLPNSIKSHLFSLLFGEKIWIFKK